ncbi:MAG: NTP transferase domain-containing protein, partial [Candidatus Adiutrix sp.]|nr:NTP transferase domain-containing protein [Candidatus Adiutrix sp.]
MIKTAMILGAGFGRRLLPLTNLRPKPLFQVLNRTMLEWWAEALVSAGVKRAVINVHHQSRLMLEHIQHMAGCFSGRLEITPSPEEGLLGTGGGIKKAEALLGKSDFLVVNADIFTDFELVKTALKHLVNPGRLATMGLLEHRPPANVSLGEGGRIVAFRAPGPVPGETGRRTYSGVMALS